ncbi:MAG: Hpt domain-containing protein [Leptospira sp.]|nr:Hpt domain-containing protein [Leptospira sp.]
MIQSDFNHSGMVHFNRANLLNKLGGNESFLKEILGMVKSGLIESDILELEQKISNKEDESSIRKIAHKVKGTALGVCFEILADYASQLERMEPWEWEMARNLIDRMESELKYLLELIEND